MIAMPDYSLKNSDSTDLASWETRVSGDPLGGATWTAAVGFPTSSDDVYILGERWIPPTVDELGVDGGNIINCNNFTIFGFESTFVTFYSVELNASGQIQVHDLQNFSGVNCIIYANGISASSATFRNTNWDSGVAGYFDIFCSNNLSILAAQIASSDSAVWNVGGTFFTSSTSFGASLSVTAMYAAVDSFYESTIAVEEGTANILGGHGVFSGSWTTTQIMDSETIINGRVSLNGTHWLYSPNSESYGYAHPNAAYWQGVAGSLNETVITRENQLVSLESDVQAAKANMLFEAVSIFLPYSNETAQGEWHQPPSPYVVEGVGYGGDMGEGEWTTYGYYVPVAASDVREGVEYGPPTGEGSPPGPYTGTLVVGGSSLKIIGSGVQKL